MHDITIQVHDICFYINSNKCGGAIVNVNGIWCPPSDLPQHE